MLPPNIAEMMGLIGGLLILGAWALETLEAIKKHKSLLDLRFSAVSLVGAVLLAVYSAELKIWIFLWLNITIATIILFEILYSLHVEKIHRRR